MIRSLTSFLSFVTKEIPLAVVSTLIEWVGKREKKDRASHMGTILMVKWVER